MPSKKTATKKTPSAVRKAPVRKTATRVASPTELRASRQTGSKPKAGAKGWVGPGVRVRTYRPGLGDCFLLSFGDGKIARHVLIDCGVFTGTSGGKARLRKIASDVAASVAAGAENGSSQMAAMVATHEHWDHVAGFYYAKDIYKKLKPEKVWVAWTEDPTQTIAVEKKERQNGMAAAAAAAVERLMAQESPYDRECGAAIANVLGFGGEVGSPVLGAAFAKRSNEGMDFVSKELVEDPMFLKPGEVISGTEDWVPGGLRIYVLGPPMDRDALIQDRTPIEEGFKTEKTTGAHSAWMAAVLGAEFGGGMADRENWDRLRPFDAARALPEEDVFRESGREKLPDGAALASDEMRAWETKMPLFADYVREDWRRIDADWLHSSASLALQLDRSINNTSLVLAFELVASGKVLLFVGDAELENWKSWQNLKFRVKGASGRTRTVRTKDLLARTVFYKVGHHGSGNATLRAALAAMTSAELVAAVPTDEIFAREKQGWEMPAALLRPELHKKTKGRVIYADPGKAAITKPKDGLISARQWKQFEDAIQGGGPKDLFVDYVIDLPK